MLVSTGGIPTQYPAVTIVNSDGTAFDPTTDIVQPVHHGFLAWTDTPAAVAGTPIAATSGFAILSKIWVPSAVTVNTVTVVIGTAGAGLTAGQNFAGLYSSAGTQLGVTADQTVAFGSTGAKAMALTAPVALTAGTFIWAAVLAKGTTVPLFYFHSGVPNVINVGLTAATARGGYFGAGALTALPASFTPNTLVLNYQMFVGLS